MFDLEAALGAAGDRYAIEWARLEKRGVEVAYINGLSDLDVTESGYLPFMRARNCFFSRVQDCESAGVSIQFRYKVFIAAGCVSNPGVQVPTLAIWALMGVLIIMAMLATNAGVAPGLASGLLISFSGIIILTWNRFWLLLTYLKICHWPTGST